MDSKIRKSSSLLALSTIEKAALETAALHTFKPILNDKESAFNLQIIK